MKITMPKLINEAERLRPLARMIVRQALKSGAKSVRYLSEEERIRREKLKAPMIGEGI
jgi:hypothetical protein